MKDGGTAFPTNAGAHGIEPTPGMSLRDYLAAAAPNGLLTNPSLMSPGQLKASRHHAALVTLANELADAMPEARKPKKDIDG